MKGKTRKKKYIRKKGKKEKKLKRKELKRKNSCFLFQLTLCFAPAF
jgi:hypothetical protein